MKLNTYIIDNLQRLVRVKKILEKLSRTRFFTGFESPALFSLLRSREEKGGIFKPRKKSCS